MDQPRLTNQLFILVFPEVTDDEQGSLSGMAAAAETVSILVSMAVPLDVICFHGVEHNPFGHWRTHLAQRRVGLYVVEHLYEFLWVIFVHLKM